MKKTKLLVAALLAGFCWLAMVNSANAQTISISRETCGENLREAKVGAGNSTIWVLPYNKTANLSDQRYYISRYFIKPAEDIQAESAKLLFVVGAGPANRFVLAKTSLIISYEYRDGGPTDNWAWDTVASDNSGRVEVNCKPLFYKAGREYRIIVALAPSEEFKSGDYFKINLRIISGLRTSAGQEVSRTIVSNLDTPAFMFVKEPWLLQPKPATLGINFTWPALKIPVLTATAMPGSRIVLESSTDMVNWGIFFQKERIPANYREAFEQQEIVVPMVYGARFYRAVIY